VQGSASATPPTPPARAPHAITAWLSRTRPSVFSAYAIVAAFSTYFCMYAFRKPFTAAKFEGEYDVPGLGALDWKIILVVSQVLGYTLSKFAGIKVVSEMTPARRGLAILALIGTAEIALGLFAVTPAPWSAVWLFANGIPLGMIWGLVFGFLEGRRTTEALGAGLSASYIVASGAVKTVGAWVLGWGVSQEAMPFVVGLLFFPPLLAFVFLLSRLPPPSAEDEALRVRRSPMHGSERKRFFMAFAPGLLLLTGLYFLLTAYRTIRDDFAADIWRELGFGERPEIMTWSEIPVALGVLVGLGALMRIRDNRRALLVVHLLMAASSALIGLITLAFEAGLVSPEVWMITVGVGLYVAYVPFGSMLFDRLIAAVGWVATAGFMIYVTDAIGYVGSVSLTLYKSLGADDLSWLEFFTGMSYLTSIVCGGAFFLSGIYFAHRTRARPSDPSFVLERAG
jgi:hypothetical protein